VNRDPHALIAAVRTGDPATVARMLDGAPADWYQVAWALVECVVLDRLDLATILVAHASASGTGSTMKARKALLEAVRLCRNEPMFEALLGSDQSSLGRAVRQDVYHAAVRAKCEPAIRALKKAGVDQSGVVSEEVIPECETVDPQPDAAIDESLFERAADAVAFGRLEELRSLLDATPALVHARSHREHRCTLFNYCAANGTEDERQRTPPNAPAIARLLLARGADPNARCRLYGGAQSTMGLMLTSAMPVAEKLDGELAAVFLEFGATLSRDELMGAIEFGLLRSVRVFITAGAPADNLFLGAGLGREDVVSDLLARGVDVNTRFAAAGFGTALHAAAALDQTQIAELLLAHGADRTLINRWESTPADTASFFGHRTLARVIKNWPSPV
jgi:hypothetical protein